MPLDPGPIPAAGRRAPALLRALRQEEMDATGSLAPADRRRVRSREEVDRRARRRAGEPSGRRPGASHFLRGPSSLPPAQANGRSRSARRPVHGREGRGRRRRTVHRGHDQSAEMGAEGAKGHEVMAGEMEGPPGYFPLEPAFGPLGGVERVTAPASGACDSVREVDREGPGDRPWSCAPTDPVHGG
jgi:hypothetical protein